MTRPKPKPTIQELRTSFELALRADNKAHTTIKSYLEALDLFDAYLEQHDLPRVVRQIERQHITLFKADQVARWKPTTASNRFKSLQQFFRWAVAEDELDHSPMDGLKAPHVPEVPIDAIRDEELEQLLKACQLKDFRDSRDQDFRNRRDTALFSLLYDTGMHVSEMAHITLADLHLERKEVDIVAKGRIQRIDPFGTETARALDRYLRQARSTRPKADLPWLWLGPKGHLTDSGIRQILDARASQAGLGHHNPHQFRHAWAASLKRAQAPHEVIKRLGGWKTDAMVNRYGAKDADDRPRAAYPQYSPMDRLRRR